MYRKNRKAAILAAAFLMAALTGCAQSGGQSASEAGSTSQESTAEASSAAGSESAAEGTKEAADADASKKAANPGGKDGVFTIAYAPNESTDQSTDARSGMAKDLEAVLGCPVEEILASDYNAIIEALRTDKADMAYMGALAVALGSERAQVEPIAMKAEDGDRSKAVYHSDLIVRADNADINSITDIKGKSIAFVDPDSTSGNLVPTAEILKAFPNEGLDSNKLHTNGDFFEAVSFSGSHQAGLQAVIKGDVDIAPISDQILASEISKGAAKKEDVKVIHESAEIPAEAVVVSASVDDATKQELQNFLVSYDNQAYFTDVIKNPKARFIPASISDYEPIIELNKLINEE